MAGGFHDIPPNIFASQVRIRWAHVWGWWPRHDTLSGMARHRTRETPDSDDDQPLAVSPRDITEREVATSDFATRAISQRIRDVVDRIAIAPDARVLEVGCGDGQAATVVCERLGDGGSMLAMDRSPVMIAATGERNDVHLLAGLLEVRAARIARATLEPGSFDVIFGINVRDMWDDAATARTLRAALAPEGRLWAILQLPPGRDATGVDTKIAAKLGAAGFEVVQSGTFDAGQTPGGWVECAVGADA